MIRKMSALLFPAALAAGLALAPPTRAGDEKYSGDYQLSANVVLTISPSDDHYRLQRNGHLLFDIYPQGGDDFASHTGPHRIAFTLDAAGVANGLTLDGDLHATRIDHAAAADIIKRANSSGVDSAPGVIYPVGPIGPASNP